MTRSAVWLDAARPVEERVTALVAEMTLDELVGQLHMTANLDASSATDAALMATGAVGSTLLASGATAGSVRDSGVSRTRVDALQDAASASRLGVPLLVARDVIHGHRTVFPIPLGLAASFDADLVERIGRRMAEEAAADGISWIFAPMIDLVEDARWGRVAESLGEDPEVTGRLGAALVRGLQAGNSLTACAKHFVGYGLSRGGRDYAGVDVGLSTLRNAHLRPFRAAVDAGVGTVMAAFSAVDGIPMHSHRMLLRGVLKQEWGFDGVVVADWDGVGELVAHGVAADLRDAARLAIGAGIDVDMVSGAYAAHLAELVAEGEVDRALVEDAARRMLRLKVRLGLLDPPAPRGGPPATPAGTGLDRTLAREAASASLVVLKDDTLPIDTRLPLLVTGPFVHERESLLGTWVLDGDPATATTIEEAFAEAFQDEMDVSLQVDAGLFTDRALRRAREAATTVAVMGEHAARSGEDSAASDAGLPPGSSTRSALCAPPVALSSWSSSPAAPSPSAPSSTSRMPWCWRGIRASRARGPSSTSSSAAPRRPDACRCRSPARPDTCRSRTASLRRAGRCRRTRTGAAAISTLLRCRSLRSARGCRLWTMAPCAVRRRSGSSAGRSRWRSR